jgi:hypothetical protein
MNGLYLAAFWDLKFSTNIAALGTMKSSHLFKNMPEPFLTLPLFSDNPIFWIFP